MANAREIKSRINSVQDTMKITNAMYMISSSKMKKAKKILSDTEPYFYNMQSAIAQYFSKKNVDMDGSFRYTVQKPTMHRARMISEEVIRSFLDREVDEVHIIYTQMQNAVVMEAVNMQLLPLKKTSFSPLQIPAEIHQEEIEMFPSAELSLIHI